MAKGDKITCRVCGASSVQKGNRPKEYCDNPACSDFIKYMRAMENALSKIKWNKNSNKSEWKRELMLIRNTGF